METTEKNGVMSTLRNRKGFSLVEMAVVLVIIGIIIGAVMKGQDLITNSRAKQVATAVDTWRALALAYLDRNGRLPGDMARDGVIGRAFMPYSTSLTTEGATANSAVTEITNTMINAPSNPITVGSSRFYVYFGYTQSQTPGVTRNIMTICKDSACALTFSSDELEIIKAIDTAFDGNADAGKGQFRGNSATVGSGGVLPAATNVIRDIPLFKNFSSAGRTPQTPWTTTYTSAVWAFDRPW